jgi:hypothetical protein
MCSPLVMREWVVVWREGMWTAGFSFEELFVGNEFDVVDVGPDGAELVVTVGVLPADPGPRGAIGWARSCHEVFERYREAGADELVLHGSTPDRLGSLFAQYGSIHPNS